MLYTNAELNDLLAAALWAGSESIRIEFKLGTPAPTRIWMQLSLSHCVHSNADPANRNIDEMLDVPSARPQMNATEEPVLGMFEKFFLSETTMPGSVSNMLAMQLDCPGELYDAAGQGEQNEAPLLEKLPALQGPLPRLELQPIRQ
jgi:hypothetical protein